MSAVLIDFNRHTAIVVSKGYKLAQLIVMEEGELVVRAFSEEDLDARGFRPLDYPIKRAVRKFLQHAGGVSAKARAALTTIKEM